MHFNMVAFAFAALEFASSKSRAKTNVAELVNFAFEKSGISFADKLKAFNREKFPLADEVDKAVEYYNFLSSAAASKLNYFNGACHLVSTLNKEGILNFITSAVEQSELDLWAKTEQGAKISPELTEILGKREGFNKGRDHFDYVCRNYDVERIYYVADASAEIKTGCQFQRDYGIVPIGFANCITNDNIKNAYEIVDTMRRSVDEPDAEKHGYSLNPPLLQLPTEQALQIMLADAGASYVVSGTADNIYGQLSEYFQKKKVLVG